VFISEAIEMGLNLVVQLGLTTAPAEKSAHAREEYPQQRHGSCSKMRVRITTVLARLSVSAASCFLPALVMA
jgi:hypothetical protein